MSKIKVEFHADDLVNQITDACTTDEFEDLVVDMVERMDIRSVTARIIARLQQMED